MKTNIEPVADRILIELLSAAPKPEERLIGGVFIPENSALSQSDDELYAVTRIIRVGLAVTAVKAGQRIMVARSQTWIVRAGGMTSSFVRERDIIAIVEDET